MVKFYKSLLQKLSVAVVAILFVQNVFSQGAIVHVTVTQVQALQNLDCDNPLIFNTPSDWVWEYEATDNTMGFSNNNPALLESFNYTFINNNNGPVTLTPNSIFFDHQYPCPSAIPTTMNIVWEGYENDNVADYAALGVGKDGSTGNQGVSMTVPAIGGTATQTFSATGGSSCAQSYTITFRVDVLPLSIPLYADAICNAPQVPIGGIHDYAFCGNLSLQAGEPIYNGLSFAPNGSGWVYFVAPASGRVDISTDVGATDFGTEIVIYHAADGSGCTGGVRCATGSQIKDKFEYLSFTDWADNGGFLNLGSEADISFDDCNGILYSNPLVPGETYYIQVTSDDPNQKGYISMEISNLGGSGAPGYDVPCQAATANPTTTLTSFGNGNGPSVSMDFSCANGNETGGFNTGNNATNFHAYEYDHNATNNGSVDEALWVKFTAPNSGRIVFESDVRGLFNVNESENNALFGFDPAFAPGKPSDYKCSNLKFIAGADGGTGFLGANPTAIVNAQCLEPGYNYYAMTDPGSAATGSTANTWFYNPSATNPSANPPANDILCLAFSNPTFYQVPVQLVGQSATLSQPGNNVNACIERLAGEPVSNSDPAQRADQTTWHYFTCPPSGAVDITVRAYTMQLVRFAIYPLLNGNSCYGGLAPAAYTTDGNCGSSMIQPIAASSAGFNGSTLPLCCLVPGARYAIQIDGGSPGDVGQYSIESIIEREVYAGDTYLTLADGTEYHDTTSTPALVCSGDILTFGTELDGLGNSTVRIPACMTQGYIIHTTNPLPDPIAPDATTGFSYIASVSPGANPVITNNGLLPQNQILYASSLADEATTWGQLDCTSASAENIVPFVLLSPIVTTQSFDQVTCNFTFSASGGLPGYNNSLFDYVITNPAGDTIFTGTLTNGQSVTLQAPAAEIFTITITDGASCSKPIVIDATSCANPCIINHVTITPEPLNTNIYDCQPDGTAFVTLFLNGGSPVVNGSNYVVTVQGSSVANVNGTYNIPLNGTPTPYTFQVADGDTWTFIGGDVNNCPDTTSGTFDFNLTNCPDACTLIPLTINPDPITNAVYDCQPNGTAIANVTINGGAPAVNNSPYTLTLAGSSIQGVNINNYALASLPGGTPYSFTVGSGDIWNLIVVDEFNCTDTAFGTFEFNPTYCPDICTIRPVFINPNPSNPTVYSCSPDGTAAVDFVFGGGVPNYVAGSTYHVSITGSSAGSNVTDSVMIGAVNNVIPYTFHVADGDTWQMIVTDSFGCADTVSGHFTFDLINCPTWCSQAPLLLAPNPADSTVYSCNPDGSALATIVLGGGKPYFDGSMYFVTVSGSTLGGNVSNIPVTGNTGGTVNYTFLIDDGDTYTISITDEFGLCTASLTATYDFNATNCSNFCQLFPIAVLPDPLNSSIYDCNPDGTAAVTLTLTGGMPTYSGSAYQVTITGSSLQSGQFTVLGVQGGSVPFTFNVADGDTWTASVTDSEGCTDIATGLFEFNATNCADFCNLVPLTIAPNPADSTVYTCYPNQTALVTLTIGGGLPSINGSNYLVSVFGSSVGGNAINAPVAGVVGGTVTYTFLVNDGDIWQMLVEDSENCSAQVGGIYDFNTSNCADDICGSPNYNPVLINQGNNDILYDCKDGTAIVFLTLEGGMPEMDGGLTSYFITVNINGVPQQVQVEEDNSGNFTYGLHLSDGDTWFVNATDTFACSDDNLGGSGTTFDAVYAVAQATDTDLLLGESTELSGVNSVGNNLTYEWTPVDGLQNPTSVTTAALPLVSTYYVLQVVDDLGCADLDSLFVRVGPCVAENSGFTPNGDGTNDLWEIPCLMLYDNETKVYNRWGEQVFFEKNYRGTWNGTSNGKDLPDGTYYYVIDVFYPNNVRELLKGNVTIIR